MAKKLTDKQKGEILGNAVSGLTGGIALGVSNAQTVDLSAKEAELQNLSDTQFDTGSYDALEEQLSNNIFAKTNYTTKDLQNRSFKELGLNTVLGTAGGLISGLSKGSILGGIIEGGAALLGGTTGMISNYFKTQNDVADLNNAGVKTNNIVNNNIVNSASSIDNKMFNSSLLNLSAYGGPLFNHGGDWSNGLTFINEGGTHEQNPFGGVPVGVDQEGTPNLVEEGEIIWNDYVFSNRLKPTKKQLETVGFNPKYEGMTFAEVIEIVQQESAEIPLDKISTDTLNENLMYLMTMQEEIRMKKEAKKNKFDLGGPTDSTAVAIRNLANQIAEEQYYKHLGYPNAEVGKRIQKEQKYTKAINSLFERLPIENTLESILSKFSKKEKATGRNKKESDKFKYGGSKGNVFEGTGNETNILGHLYETAEEAAEAQRLIEEENALLNGIADTEANTIMGKVNAIIPALEQSVRDYEMQKAYDSIFNTDKQKAPKANNNPFVNAGTIAPLISSAGQLIYNTLKPIDKSNVIAAKAYSKVPMMSLPRIGGKKSFTPTDKNQYINPIIAQGNSTARALQNSGINASQTLGSLIASNYNTQKAISEALNTIDQADFTKEMQVGQFNLGIDQANLSASQAEQNANIIRANKLAEAELKDAQTIEALGQLKGQAINTSLNTLTKGIADLATQGINWNLIKDNPAYSDAIKHLYGNKAKCGGMLTRKKRRK